jgi:hypothetical protein
VRRGQPANCSALEYGSIRQGARASARWRRQLFRMYEIALRAWVGLVIGVAW